MFWYSIHLAIQTHAWLYWAFIVILPALAGGLVVYLALRILIRLYDRHPRESVRCRKCYYDLRATPGDVCPECGYNLTRGVWTDGRPRRLWLALTWALWTTAVIAAAVPLSRVFWQHTYYGPGGAGRMALLTSAAEVDIRTTHPPPCSVSR